MAEPMASLRDRASAAVRAPGGWPLRVRLVVAVVLLAAIGLSVTGFAAVTALRTYLYAKVDEQLVATTRSTVASTLRNQFDGPGAQQQRLPSPYFIQVTNANGSGFQLRSPTRENPYPPRLPTLTLSTAQQLAGAPFTTGSTHGHTRWRVLVTPLRDGSGTVTVAASLAETDSTVARLVWIVVIVGAAVLVLVGVLGYVLVRTSLRPLVAVEETAGAIAAGDLSQRVPALDPRTEVGRLSGALNTMLTQVEEAFRGRAASEAAARRSEGRMRQLIADASHELRTPLTSIRGFAELYRQGAVPDRAELDRLMRRIEDEAARMGLLVDDLLLLARLDQQRPMEREPVDLREIVGDAVHDAAAVATDREISLIAEVDGEPVVIGDESRLRQVLGNLLGNARTHTPVGTPIEVRIVDGTQDGSVRIEVRDHGPGLAPDQVDRVFERFYRVDASRSRGAGGTGLGLSIVAAIVAGHGGRVGVDSTPGDGATFWVLLPWRP